MLNKLHPRLPATFLHLFLGALNRWVRVYYYDALDRVERLRGWYEADPDVAEVISTDRKCSGGAKQGRDGVVGTGAIRESEVFTIIIAGPKQPEPSCYAMRGITYFEDRGIWTDIHTAVPDDPAALS